MINSFSAKALLGFAVVAWMQMGTLESLAQGTFEIVRTGDSSLTIQRKGIIINSDQSLLQFQFAFSTEEEVVPGTFLDSATASLQAVNDPAALLIIATLDRSGATWAPESPGAIPIDPDSIQRSGIPMPGLQPVLSHSSAFAVKVQIPIALQNRELNFYLDLFDNGDGLRSLAALGEITLVPEPGVISLTMGGLASLLLMRIRRR